MTAPGTTTLLEVLFACDPASAWEHRPTSQVQVTLSLQARRGRSVNRYVALVMVDYVPDETGVKGSAEKSRLFVKAMRI